MFRCEVEFLPVQQVIRIVNYGQLDVEANTELVAAGLEASRRFGTDRFIIDHRNIEVTMRLKDIPPLPKSNAEQGVTPNLRIAFLYHPLQADSQAFLLYEQLAWLDGCEQRFFTDKNAAMAWVTSRGLTRAGKGLSSRE